MLSNPAPPTAQFLAEPLRQFCTELLVSLGTPAGHARIVSDSLVAANVRGVDSHGIQMLAVYIQQVRAGGVNVAAAGRVTIHAFAPPGSVMVTDAATDEMLNGV